MLLLGVAAAGAIGAPLRYLVDGLVAERTGGDWPRATLLVNVTGSFLLGIISGLVLYHAFASTPGTILGAGFCGAYTTFSTFAVEVVHLAERGAHAEARRTVAYGLVIPALAAAAGLALAGL